MAERERTRAKARDYVLVATAEHAKKPLNVVLAEWLPQALGRPVSKAKVRKLIMAGAVYLK